MKESKFNSEVVASLKEYGAWAYKIADTPTSWLGASAMRFTPEKPCDIIGIYRKYGFLIECKQIKKFEAFGMRHMQPSQIKHLNLVTDNYGHAFVFLNIRIAKPYENRLVIFNWRDFRKNEETLKQKDVKELPYIDGHKGLFDLSRFLDEFEYSEYIR